MLRRAVLIVGGLLVLLAAVLATHPAAIGLVLYCGIYGVLIVGGILFERYQYRPNVSRQGPWQRTGERFRDPGTGELVEVFYNPETGERDYVPVRGK